MFTTVLVANRGEIAIRVMRTLREMGIRSVAVYSDADRDALFVQFADEAHALGAGPSTDTYLNIPKILEVAAASGAEAIHPGYGFLAENAPFARACEAAGVTFIGPPADAIDSMGSKTAARALMDAAGVPIVPGVTEGVADTAEARGIAEDIGYPVAVKAAAGGGGKGFRVALTPDDLEDAFEGARREGEKFFADSTVYLERYLPEPRHVEIQILADGHGTTLWLGERDCSVQRRHQKLVEETPSPIVSDALRQRMGEASVLAAEAVGYRSAGTLEYLVSGEEFFFLEMNTRIQVEHTVTEMVTGMDLVREQIRIAAGEAIGITQDEVAPRGHAFECRINAEDAERRFLPTPGPITAYREPSGPGVRTDSGDSYGLGWSFKRGPGGPLHCWHEGQSEGFSARFERYPSLGRAVVALGNLGDFQPAGNLAGADLAVGDPVVGTEAQPLQSFTATNSGPLCIIAWLARESDHADPPRARPERERGHR